MNKLFGIDGNAVCLCIIYLCYHLLATKQNKTRPDADEHLTPAILTVHPQEKNNTGWAEECKCSLCAKVWNNEPIKVHHPSSQLLVWVYIKIYSLHLQYLSRRWRQIFCLNLFKSLNYRKYLFLPASTARSFSVSRWGQNNINKVHSNFS